MSPDDPAINAVYQSEPLNPDAAYENVREQVGAMGLSAS